MFVWLSEWLANHFRYFHLFHVIQYLTLRVILAALTTLVIALAAGPLLIAWLSRVHAGEIVRNDGPKSHFSKAGTPTMGGTLLLLAILLGTLLWCDLHNRYVWMVLLVTTGLGMIGWWDDYYKLFRKNRRGLTALRKFLLQSMVGVAAACWLYFAATSAVQTALVLPFFKSVLFPLGVFFIALEWFVITGFSNAVNLTDGLDGLAILPVVMIAAALGVFAYASGNAHFARYLAIPAIPGAGELAVFCGALVGAGLGFLWFNTYPAQVFMGDMGSLALGGALAMVAVIVRQEIVLLLMGGIFVLETLSVMIQVISFRFTGKRVFRMAPIHHHFELKGWPEPRVIVRFWIITFVLVLLGLSTLKLR